MGIRQMLLHNDILGIEWELHIATYKAAVNPALSECASAHADLRISCISKSFSG